MKVNADRPDFRVFIALLHHPSREVDTSGNCRYPEDKSWTDLYICDRASDRLPIDIWIPENYWDDDDNCLEYVFNVKSEDISSEEAAAVYLFDYCGESIFKDGYPLGDADCATIRNKYSEWTLRANQSTHYTPPS